MTYRPLLVALPRRRFAAALLLGCVLSSLLGTAACGDDDDPMASDAGDKDASARAGTGGGMIGRRDAMVTGRDAVPDCDRSDPVPCPAGQSCHPVIRRAAGEAQFTLYTGCVEDHGGRARGAPCDPWGGGLAQYRADGLEDELYVDPCDADLYCAPNPDVRGAFSCQQACPLGTCASPDQQCFGPNVLEAVCRDIDRCDPLSGSGCPAGMTCYLALDPAGTRVLTSCQTTPPEPLADGVACQFVGDCFPGSSCWGPPRLPPSRWTVETLLCRPSCSTSVMASDDELDSGPEEDGGVPGSCPGTTVCRDLSASGLDVDLLETGFGQCE